MTAAEFDAVLGVIQTVFIVLIALTAAWGVWWGLWGQHRRPKPAPNLELEKNLHDWHCDTGEWPHAGDCVPGAEQDYFTALMILAQCAARGVGQVPGVTSAESAVPIRLEDERCGGE